MARRWAPSVGWVIAGVWVLNGLWAFVAPRSFYDRKPSVGDLVVFGVSAALTLAAGLALE